MGETLPHVRHRVRYPEQATQTCPQKQKGPNPKIEAFSNFNPGDDLRSHTVARAVSSARRGLTSVFGMGTGVTLAV